ncbi:MAG TPA: glycosyltransferase family 4 protein [Verrucomicrobiae bacterium]
MKIALCLEYPIGQFGGTEVLVQELIRGLAPRHELVLVSDDTTADIERAPWKKFLAAHLHWNPATMTRAQSQKLADDLAEARLDLAHFHFGGNYGWGNRAFDLCPIVPLARRGVPCLSTNHGAFSIAEGYCGAQRSAAFKAALFLPAWLSKQYVLSHLRCEIAVSMNDFHALRRWYPPMRGKFRQIYHSRLHEPAPFPETARTKHIICIGTIGPRKGQTYLTEAFCQIATRCPEWKLVLIGREGDPAMMERIHSLRREHQLEERILLLGKQSDAEVNRWLRTAAIFAMPSVAEGLGLSLQEALFHGCACVTARAGGTQDLIQNGDNGLSVAPANASALAGALEQLMGDQALRQRFAARGPASILEKGMTAEIMVKKYEDLYAEILK